MNMTFAKLFCYWLELRKRYLNSKGATDNWWDEINEGWFSSKGYSNELER